MPYIPTKVDSYKEYIHDFQYFLDKRDREEQILQEDAKDEFFFGSKTCYNRQNILKTSKIPQRVEMLYEKGTVKIALERKRGTAMSNKSHEREPAEANERQLALYKQGVAKIRQRRPRKRGTAMSNKSHEREPAGANERQLALYKQGVAKIRQQRQSAYKSQHQSDPATIKTVKGISRRQQSLYLLGVKKLRERNRKGLVVLSQVPKGNSHYIKGMYQVLPNFVAKMEHPMPFTETLLTEILESCSNKSNTDHTNTPPVISRTIKATGPFSINCLSTDLEFCYKSLHGSAVTSVRGCDKRSFSEVSCDGMDTMLEMDDNQSREKRPTRHLLQHSDIDFQGASGDIEAKYQERGETILRISSRLVVLVVVQKTTKDAREIELCIVV
jgi:hypothetical protein